MASSWPIFSCGLPERLRNGQAIEHLLEIRISQPISFSKMFSKNDLVPTVHDRHSCQATAPGSPPRGRRPSGATSWFGRPTPHRPSPGEESVVQLSRSILISFLSIPYRKKWPKKQYPYEYLWSIVPEAPKTSLCVVSLNIDTYDDTRWIVGHFVWPLDPTAKTFTVLVDKGHVGRTRLFTLRSTKSSSQTSQTFLLVMF